MQAAGGLVHAVCLQHCTARPGREERGGAAGGIVPIVPKIKMLIFSVLHMTAISVQAHPLHWNAVPLLGIGTFCFWKAQTAYPATCAWGYVTCLLMRFRVLMCEKQCLCLVYSPPTPMPMQARAHCTTMPRTMPSRWGSLRVPPSPTA